MKTPAQILGGRIRAARKTRGWTQQQLAREVHVSQALISLAENGLTDPGEHGMRRLAAALDAPQLLEPIDRREMARHLLEPLAELDDELLAAVIETLTFEQRRTLRRAVAMAEETADA